MALQVDSAWAVTCRSIVYRQLIGRGEHGRRHGGSERLGGFEIDSQLKPGRPHNRRLSRFLALETTAGADVGFVYGFIPAHAASLTRSSRNTRSSLPPVNSRPESSLQAGPLMRSRCIVASRARGTTSTPPPSHSTRQRRPDAFSLHIPLVRRISSFPRRANCARNQCLSAFPGAAYKCAT